LWFFRILITILFTFFERASPQSGLEGQKRVVEMDGELLLEGKCTMSGSQVEHSQHTASAEAEKTA
jgi:hypothetical protein